MSLCSSSPTLCVSVWCLETATDWLWWTTSRKPCSSIWAHQSSTAHPTPTRGSLAPHAKRDSPLEVSRSDNYSSVSFVPGGCSLSTAKRLHWLPSLTLISLKLTLYSLAAHIWSSIVLLDSVWLSGGGLRRHGWHLAAAVASHRDRRPLQ